MKLNKLIYIFIIIVIISGTSILTSCPTYPGSQADSITYKMTFTSLWSTITHPTSFPSNPHLSGVVGMTHNSSVQLFTAGTKASLGIESMAETGAKATLLTEIQGFITAETAKTVIDGSGISSSPGSVTVEITVHKSHPLVSMATMIAPSPDWFVAIKNVRLFENEKWARNKVVDVSTYDAGTDGGIDYESVNVLEDKNIQLITTPPLANRNTGIIPRMGYVTFTPK